MASLNPISGTLGRARAAHLLRRATFGCKSEDIDHFASLTVNQAVSQLLTFPSLPTPPPHSSGAFFDSKGKLLNGTTKVLSWWLYQSMMPGQAPTLFYRIAFFLHTCLTTSMDGKQGTPAYQHVWLLLKYVDKSYKELVRKMCQDNLMGGYLDIANNTNTHPNENFARELMELFTLGKGPQIGPGNYTNYTEDDIREAAKVLTGWKITGNYTDQTKMDPDLGWVVMFASFKHHDTSNKQFSSTLQNATIQGATNKAGMYTELDELIELIFSQDAVSLFIMRKLYRYLVNYQITKEIEDDIIEELALIFRQSNFHFRPVLEALFKSQHFYDEDDSQSGDETIGSLIKSPLELALSSAVFFGCKIPDINIDMVGTYEWLFKLETWIEKMGMDFWKPSSVAGYEPMYQEPSFNRHWITPITLPLRYNVMFDRFVDVMDEPICPDGMFNVLNFVEDPKRVKPFAGPDPKGNPGPHDGARIADHLVREITNYLFAVELDTDRIAYFRDDLLLEQLSPINWMFEWDNYKNTGNASNIYPQLVKLFKGIIQSPEFQLM
jgi:uncharacterized protein (DUF1800 family)